MSGEPVAHAGGAKRGRVASPLRPATSIRPRRTGLSLTEIVALVLSLGWLSLMAWFFLTIPESQARIAATDPIGFMMMLLGVLLPVGLVWVAASAARTARVMREESIRLEAAIDAMRNSYLENREAGLSRMGREMTERLDQVALRQAEMQTEMASLRKPAETPAPSSKPAVRPMSEPESTQRSFALDVAPDPEPLPADDFIRALNFPDNERDQEGFRVLRAALGHHPTAQLVTASQDLLTLLAEDGIFMDDLAVHRADPVLWRAFAGGERGPEIAALGGVRDRSSLALTTGRMKDDPAFRDAVHHFLRTFDRVFSLFASEASDAEIRRFAETRTARAFMVTARAAGVFDQAPNTSQRVSP